MADAPEPVLGIDLGTTNSACAVVRDGRASVVRRGDDRIVPSVVAIAADGSWLVGERAKRRRLIEPQNVVYSSKRLIGRRFGSLEVQRMRELVPYRITEGHNEAVMIEVGGRQVSVVEVASRILTYLRDMAEEALGQRARRAVIAVPANFTDSQRSATRIAARLAGLDVIRVINEPTAAALAYGYIEDVDRRIVVYDFGGGTFDVTILQITRNVFEVLATSGEMFLGGDDIDQALLRLMSEDFQRRFGADPTTIPVALERLRSSAEQVKIQLSENARASVRLHEFFFDHPSDYEFTISASDVRPYVDPIVRRTVPVCEDAMASAGLDAGQIDEIVLVGGTTRLPQVVEVVREVFGKTPQTSINPMSVVAVGAAIQGAALVGSLVPIAGSGDDTSVPAAPTSPASAVLLDVVPRSLGVRTAGGFVDFLIERNTAIPVEVTRLFSTAKDNQQYVRIQVAQGEQDDFDANHKLGELVLSSLRPGPRGEVQIAVTFEINTDGLLEVRARDETTGQRQVATMRVLGGVTDEELAMDRKPPRSGSFGSGEIEPAG